MPITLPPREQYHLDQGGFRLLSGREEQVLSFASAGYIDKQISREIGVTLNTLRTYWARIRMKIGDAPRSALAAAYVRHVTTDQRPVPDLGPVPVVAVVDRAVIAKKTSAEEDNEYDWEIDLVRDVFKKLSNRPNPVPLPMGEELPLEETLTYFHPEDQPRIRALIVSIREGAVEEFTYSGRLVTPQGIVMGCAVVRVLKDDTGRPIKAVGRRLADFDPEEAIATSVTVGNWTRNLLTGETAFDDGFCSVFRLPRTAGDLRDQALARFHPDEVKAAVRLLSDAVAAGRERVRATSRLMFEDGTVLWVVLGLKIEYDDGKAHKVYGTVMSF